MRDAIMQAVASLALSVLAQAVKRPAVRARVRQILPERLGLDDALKADGR